MTVTPALDTLLTQAWDLGASALLMVSGQRPRARVGAELTPLGEDPVPAADVADMARALFGERRLARQEREGSASVCFRVDAQRFGRATVSTALGDYTLGIRLRSTGSVPSLERCGLPTVLPELLQAGHGLILVSGPHGSGKTTTLYSMLDWINQHRAVHVCTVEDPIEFELDPGQALLQQREVGTDVPDVASGIAAAMEQDLDVLLVGGLADLESLSAAVHAAETGHLVLLQVHARDAYEALERLIEAAPHAMQPMIQRALAETLRGVIGQRLVRKVGGGRQAACQVLIPDDALRARIASGASLREYPGDARSVTLHDELARLESEGVIDGDEVARARLQ